MRGESAAKRLLEELATGCPSPDPDDRIQHAYRPVAVSDHTGWQWPGTITAWGTGPCGSALCHLRLSGVPAPRWVVHDPDRITLLVQEGI
ncbi:hypothetical protein AB5J72_01525 [Streptomyces sp. CG1]|uniref:hypothetical protein n=1 Tax=Streptomyces sp. CG1 TaxID=1287523 RepID=UPI0034E22EFF